MSSKILWIGMFASEEQFEIMQKKGDRQVAAQYTQKNYIDGIEHIMMYPIDTINAHVLPAYPKYADWCIIEEHWSHKEGSKDINVGFINLKYINHISRMNALKKAAKEWGLEQKNNKDVKIIVYAMHSPYMAAAKVVKKVIPTAKIYLIVPDLPQNMDISMKGLKKKLKVIDWQIIKNLMKNVDGYVLYTNQMADYFKLQQNQWIRIEGSVNVELEKINNLLENKHSKKVCLYAGTLKQIYKFDIFVQAFINADLRDAELHIYGSGDLASKMTEIANKHPNVKYFGFQSNDNVVAEELKATVLVNPRPTNEEYTKYSCPSKNLEYMVSGTPLLTTRLAGIPEKYFDYVYTIEDESLEGLTRVLRNILSKSREELHEKGKQAKEFMLREKNNVTQARKILEFIGVI